MTSEQRSVHNARQREYQLRRYRSDEAFRQVHIERVKRCCTKKAAGALTKEQLDRRRASDAVRQARHRAAKKAATSVTP